MELGLGGSEGVSLGPDPVDGTLTADPLCASGLLTSPCAGPAGEVWFRYDKGRNDLRVTAFGGSSTMGGVGAAYAYRVVDTDQVFVAPQLSLGFLYGALGLPVGISVAPRTWFVLTPSAVASATGPFRLSEGLWADTSRRVALGVELQEGVAPDGVLVFTGAAHVGFSF